MNRNASEIVVTKVGLSAVAIMLSLMLFGFSQSLLAPQSLLGKLTSSGMGMLAWTLIICALCVLAERLLSKCEIKFWIYRQKS